MEKSSFLRRFVVPVLTLFVIMAACFVAYKVAPRLGNYALHQATAMVSGVIFFLCLWFGSLFVYPVSCLRGASVAERIAASLVNPFVFATKEVFRITVSFTVLESLYFYLNPLCLGVFFVAIAEMGLSEMLVREARRRRGEAVRILSVPAIVSFLVGISLAVFILAWGRGEYTFYIFLQGFRKLFGPGVGV